MVKSYMSLSKYIVEYQLKNIKITHDINAWIEYPEFNFIYNKLWIATSQELNCGPMGVYPEEYPIVFKPIINLYGMSRGFKIINNEEEYDMNIKDGFFWEEYITGDHYCVDLILIKGNIKFCSALKSHADIKGSFLYHESEPEYILPEHIKFWISLYFKDYCGAMNLEIINGLIIEGHLRLNGDFHLYNIDFVKHLDNFYKTNIWNLNYIIKKIYIIPIFTDVNISSDDYVILKKKVLKFTNENKINSLLIDNIHSKSQSEFLVRTFMLEVDDYSILEKIIIFKKKLRISKII